MLRIWQKTEKQKLEPVGMGTAFPFLKEKNHVVSIIGGGGKTTLLYEMAGFCVKNDQKVLVTTSTHIYRPPKEWHDQSLEAVERKFRTGRAAIIGSACRDPEKLSMPETELFEAARKKADLTLIEADGARHLQCKAPAEHEPVLLSSSDLVIGVTGLSALGQPLGKGCFRAERAAELLGCTMEHHITEEDLARLIASEQGQQKDLKGRTFYAVLHQYEEKNTGRPPRNLWSCCAGRGSSMFWLRARQETEDKAVRTRIPGMGEQSFPCVKRKKSGNPENKTEIERRRQMAEFTHFKKDGSAVMVDVHEKPDTYRAASATGTIQVSPEVFAAVRDHTAKKGDVLGVARLAGIMGAKKNAELIPLCHIVPLTNCEVTFTTDENTNSITAVCTTSCVGKTGVEMEALTGVSTALLTIYDMCKAMDRGMVIRDIHILEKDGGKSGHYIYQKEEK